MKLLRQIQLGSSIALGLAFVLAAVLATPAKGQVVVFDTGFSLPVVFNGTVTNLGWTSGNNSAGAQPQRWTAQPFSLTDETRITQINAEYFIAGGTVTDIGIMIWNRTGG